MERSQDQHQVNDALDFHSSLRERINTLNARQSRITRAGNIWRFWQNPRSTSVNKSIMRYILQLHLQSREIK